MNEKVKSLAIAKAFPPNQQFFAHIQPCSAPSALVAIKTIAFPGIGLLCLPALANKLILFSVAIKAFPEQIKVYQISRTFFAFLPFFRLFIFSPSMILFFFFFFLCFLHFNLSLYSVLKPCMYVFLSLVLSKLADKITFPIVLSHYFSLCCHGKIYFTAFQNKING